MNYKSSLNNPIFRTVQIVADELNYPIYVVGGWVRDLFLRRKQEVIDIDFVCVGNGVTFDEQVSKKLVEKSTFKVVDLILTL